jgi:hypothetical protein
MGRGLDDCKVGSTCGDWHRRSGDEFWVVGFGVTAMLHGGWTRNELESVASVFDTNLLLVISCT